MAFPIPEYCLPTSTTLPTDVLIPRSATLVEIEDKYGPLADEVQCGLVGCRTGHKAGFIVSFKEDGNEDLSRGIIGHMCGQKNFGTNWKTLERQLNIRQRKAELDAEFEKFLAEGQLIRAQLLPMMEGLHFRSVVRNAINYASEDHLRFWANIFSSGKTYVDMRDATGRHHKGRLKGEAFFRRDKANKLARQIVQGVEAAQRIANATLVELKAKRDKLAAMSRGLEDILAEARDGELALTPANMALAVAAADEARLAPRIRVEGDRLKVFSYSSTYDTVELIYVCDLKQSLTIADKRLPWGNNSYSDANKWLPQMRSDAVTL